jgi:3-methyladenine DNA glycosylase AlkD
MNKNQVLAHLHTIASEKRIQDMKRVNINVTNTIGVSIYQLRYYAKKIGKNHDLAQDLWQSEIHEARLLACLNDDVIYVTEEQMEEWVLDFNSWDICDQCCSNLFDKTPYAIKKALDWSKRDELFVKRAGFVLMACLSVHNKQMVNDKFDNFFDCIVLECYDNRNFVKKAVNWALRQIGKRNLVLNKKAIQIAESLSKIDDKNAQWIAKNALSELKSEKIQKRLVKKQI